MTTMRWFRTGGPRGNPAHRRANARHPVVFLALALAALGQTGCQTGLCNGCGPIATGWRNLTTLTTRVARPIMGKTPCCGGDLGTEAPAMQYNNYTPGEIVTPAPTITSPSTLGPASSGSLPTDLTPIPDRTPSATPGPPPAGVDSVPSTGAGAKSSAGKATYEAARPKTIDSTPEPTNRSAQGSSRSKADDDANPLDNLPPIDVPGELSRNGQSTPPASIVAETAKATPAGEPANPVPPSALELAVAPGIRRFSGVEQKLSGGSLPTAEGLDWLVEKGCKTVLDLRDESEMSVSFLTEATRRGLRYVALPVSAKTLDADHLTRFHLELALADARPLYFFDTDGSRAGVLWYLHRVTVDHVARDAARRDCEELGLTDGPLLDAANALLNGLKPTPAATPAAAPTTPAAKPPNPAPTPAPAPATVPSNPPAGDPAKPAKAASNAPEPASAGPAPTASNEDTIVPRDPTAWRSFAAMIVTGLGIPLAYVSRTALPTGFRAAAARASLTASARRPRSLPGASGD